MSNFWDLMWLIFSAFVFVAYLVVLFQIVVDLFRDSELGGISKAAWIVGLLVLPFLTALVYVIARGAGMAQRQRSALQQMRSQAETQVRALSGKSPVEQIADAKALLDAGTINADEFAKLNAKALA
jgi:ABC-type multidrug transport system fused ATPase/permease subunit